MPSRSGAGCLGSQPVAPGTDAEIAVQLPQAMPIFLTYITAHVGDGKLSYLPDIYGWDTAAAAVRPSELASN